MTTTDKQVYTFIEAVGRRDGAAAVSIALDRVPIARQAVGVWVQLVPRMVMNEKTEFRVCVRVSNASMDAGVAEVELAWPMHADDSSDRIKQLLSSVREVTDAAASHDPFRAYARSMIGSPALPYVLLIRRPSGEEFREPVEGIAYLATLVALSAAAQREWVQLADSLHQDFSEALFEGHELSPESAQADPVLHAIARGVEAALLEALHRW